MNEKLAAVVMAGGRSTRMRSAVPKHLHPLLGRRLIDWTIAAARAVEPSRLVVVASPETRDAYADRERGDGLEVAVQEQPRGSGDAAAAARRALRDFDGDVLVLADTPLLTGELLAGLLEEHRRQDASVTLLSFEPPFPLPYGRVLRDDSGALRAIVEEGDATPEQRAIGELNASIYAFRADRLWRALDRLDDRNAQGELYLTDTIAHIVADGGRAAVFRSPDATAPLGVNTREELAQAAAVLRMRINRAHMLAGATILDPDTTWIDADVALDPDTTIHPFTVLRGRTHVRAGAEVGPHAVCVDAEIGEGALVGPFCYLRPGTVLGAGAKAGTFVEVKNSSIGERAKVPHLSYIGDADIGEDTNIGAGAITANYRPELGPGKQRTRIGRNVRAAVHNAFVAPVEVGDDAWTGAGSVITDDVPSGALAIARARQVTKEGYVGRRRDD